MSESLQLFLVEDNDDVAYVLRRCLERAGHQTTVCRNGADALIVLSHSQFHLVVLDYYLEDMSGLELLQKEAGPRSAMHLHDPGERVEPFARLGNVDIAVATAVQIAVFSHDASGGNDPGIPSGGGVLGDCCTLSVLFFRPGPATKRPTSWGEHAVRYNAVAFHKPGT